MRRIALLLGLLFVFAATPADARPSSQAVPRPAPAWNVSEWINSEDMELADLKGRVVIIDFFQLWCPGCNAFSIPLIKVWEQKFAAEIKAGRLLVVSIHTVFEGFDYQTPRRLRKFLKRKSILHPVGVDHQLKGDRLPVTMRRFGTMGTPEIAIVDKSGVIRFQEFGGFHPRRAEFLIRRLLRENPAS